MRRDVQGADLDSISPIARFVQLWVSAWALEVRTGKGDESSLTVALARLYTNHMAQTFLVFEFGTNEEAAQQARLTLERWKQSFRLDKKLLLKFDREEPAEEEEEKPAAKATKKAAESKEGRIMLIVRLDFSDHEKLSQHRWVERIPAETLFKEAHPKVIRNGDGEFDGIAKRFEGLS
jgi:hypothetical protein